MSAGNWNGRQVTMAAVGMAIVMALTDYFNFDLFNVARAEQAVYVVPGDGWLVIWRDDGAPRVAAIPVGAKWARGWNADGTAPTHVAVIEEMPGGGDRLRVVPVP